MDDIRNDLKDRDAIDFASASVPELFRKMFIPTLLGMLSMVVLNLADGAFVGHGVGSNALAAVNIAAPIYNIMTGIGLMFGTGASVIASIHLSRGNVKAARINMTQGMLGAVFLGLVAEAVILLNLEGTCRFFGSDDELLGLSSTYLKWVAMSLPFQMAGFVGEFSARLDGSPKFAMWCTVFGAGMNIFLDWLFVFPLRMGLEGAAKATTISFSISGLALLHYVLFSARTMKLYKLRMTLKSFALTIRNQLYQIKAGFPALLGEMAVCVMVIVGNHVFMKHLGDNGVAAYSVACYCLPIILMLANSVIQSMQPVISYAYGIGDAGRVRKARNLELLAAAVAGLVVGALLCFGRKLVASLFLPPGTQAFSIVVNGLPYFSTAAVLMSFNLAVIGYCQSVEQSVRATVFMLLRGFVFILPMFVLLPELLGIPGIWLAIPCSELATLIVISTWSFLCLHAHKTSPLSESIVKAD